jgi:hypothetical protein
MNSYDLHPRARRVLARKKKSARRGTRTLARRYPAKQAQSYKAQKGSHITRQRHRPAPSEREAHAPRAQAAAPARVRLQRTRRLGLFIHAPIKAVHDRCSMLVLALTFTWPVKAQHYA